MAGIRMTQDEYESHLRKMKKPIPVKEQAAERIEKPRMSKTEREYERIYLRDVPHKFEGITLKMSNGHRYTPDFYVPACREAAERSDMPEMHEVKGGYRLGSYGRARLAFDQARLEYPEFKFIWATKTKEGWVIR